MTCHQDVIDRGLQRAVYGLDRPQLKGSNVFAEGDVIYSYGHHFELVRVLRDKDREVSGFLLNGDLYSNTTSRHQSIARASVSRVAGPGRPSAIIPYSALGAAGIEPRNVEIVNASPDGCSARVEEHFSLPPGALWEWVEQSDYRERFPDEIQAVLAKDFDERLRKWTDAQEYAAQLRERPDQIKSWTRGSLAAWLVKRPAARTYEQWIAAGSSDWERKSRARNWLPTHYTRVCWVSGRKQHAWEVEFLDDGTTSYRREHVRHWLGESLIRAKIHYRKRPKCPACKGRPMEGPSQREWMEHDEVDWLKDEQGHYVESYRYSFSRAFDIPPQRCDTCSGDGRIWTHHTRTAYFLSGFDHQEVRRSYFFCELPRGAKPTTVAEAYEALKPDAVSLAESMGREVLRQGDIFAIPTARFKKELIAAGGVHGRMLGLLGTNHCATEVITLGALTYARGILHHIPGGRPPDHARVKLGQGWHLVVKNTVPLSA